MALDWVDIPEDEHFANMFGCVEMEEAARMIVYELSLIKRWDADLNYWELMTHDSWEDQRIGLFMLAVHGWIEDMETSGEFVMTESFAQRIIDLLNVPKERRHLCI